MNEYWYFHCSGCHRKIGKRIEQAEIGRVAILNCSACGAENRVRIGVPPTPVTEEIPKEIFDALSQLQEIVENNEKIGEIVEKMARKGFYTTFHAIVFWDQSHTSHHSLTPKVKSDGEIVPGTFDCKDREFMRGLNIKL